MTAPWRNASEPLDARESAAGRLLGEATELPAWNDAEREALWRRVRASATEARLEARVPLSLWVALAGSFAFLVVSYLHQPAAPAVAPVAIAAAPVAAPALESEWTPVDLGPVGRLRARVHTVYALPPAPRGEYRIELASGELCAEIAHRDGPLVVATALAKVYVIGTQFCVEARPGATTVRVTEGRVRFQTPSGSLSVSAGESASSNDSRLKLPLVAAPAVKAPAPSALAEQNALYARAIAARDRRDGPGALNAWRDYLARYPSGILAPEASTGILGELVAEGRAADALSAADHYLAAFPGDGRAAEVAFIRGNLLRDQPGRLPDALAAYEQALQHAPRLALRDDALFAVGACQRKLGKPEARTTFERYLREFPQGTHASEVARWLR